MVEPNKEVVKQWVAALRSGEYEQGRNRLRSKDGQHWFISTLTDNKYCCLGVLCDLHSKTRDGEDWDGDKYMDCASLLPHDVAVWAGFDSYNPVVHTILGPAELGYLNDAGHTFAEIADLIEAEWLRGAKS